MTALRLPHEFPTTELTKRFWKKVTLCAHGRRCKACCWLWTSSTWPSGYGQVFLGRDEGKRIRVLAHRFAWELRHRKAIPSERFALHSCDRPLCVNPAHVVIGTQKDIRHEAARKGRLATGDRHPFRLHPETRPFGDRNGACTMPHRIVRGEHTAQAKLTDANIRSIRRAYARGRKTVRQLAAAYAVGRSTIYHVLKKETWAHVKQDPRQQRV